MLTHHLLPRPNNPSPRVDVVSYQAPEIADPLLLLICCHVLEFDSLVSLIVFAIVALVLKARVLHTHTHGLLLQYLNFPLLLFFLLPLSCMVKLQELLVKFGQLHCLPQFLFLAKLVLSFVLSDDAINLSIFDYLTFEFL